MKPTTARWWLGMAPVGLLLIGYSDNTITTTPSGLRYKELVVGRGATAKKDDLVEVHYTGWLRDGTKFDSSRDRDVPFRFVLGRRYVIAGWDEGVQGIKVGGKRKLIIPAKLAYAERGVGKDIPPNAELTFDVELLGVYTRQADGLYLRDLELGNGDPVRRGTQVEIRFTGWLSHGKQFGKGSVEFAVGSSKVIQGLSLGVEGMKRGGKRKLIVPPKLGYGDEGLQGLVPREAELVYEVELIQIK